MIRILILDGSIINVDSEEDATNLLGQGAWEMPQADVERIFGNLANTATNLNCSITKLPEGGYNVVFNKPSNETLLQEAKESKLNEIRIKRDEALNGGFIYNAHTFQTREQDKLNINGAVTNLILDMQSGINKITEIIWIDVNDDRVTFTPQEFLNFASSVAYYTQEITFKANAIKEKIEQANSKEELDLITWENE
ncbi:DUF4376 domain-containing protein [Campylobacter coli]|nr:DUF4376 domain-containing protein [Campylobacter coli]EAI4316357.1 DUF4376 domain-containing protein [Campylobacter coli]EAJ9109702.1 DUF4376 domain-containing protein [Campylobacter jejuni]